VRHLRCLFRFRSFPCAPPRLFCLFPHPLFNSFFGWWASAQAFDDYPTSFIYTLLYFADDCPFPRSSFLFKRFFSWFCIVSCSHPVPLAASIFFFTIRGRALCHFPRGRVFFPQEAPLLTFHIPHLTLVAFLRHQGFIGQTPA